MAKPRNTEITIDLADYFDADDMTLEPADLAELAERIGRAKRFARINPAEVVYELERCEAVLAEAGVHA
jgi:hypothetical protein